MVHGMKYKQQYQVSFPSFSVFSHFIREEARMRNDLSFIIPPPSRMLPSGEKFIRTARTPILVQKTEVENIQQHVVQGLDNPRKQCPINRKPHPIHEYIPLRGKLLEKPKKFLKESGICFCCFSYTSHQAKDCKLIKCSECNSNKHNAALHNDPVPWSLK